MAKRRRHARRHPGVVLIKPDPERRIGWRARYRDPDSGRLVKESLDASLTTAELREEWAARKSKALAKRRLELEGGAHRATGTGFDAALDRYFTDHGHLRPATLEVYRAAATKLKAHARASGVRSADDVRGPMLVAFRAALVKERRQVRARGGKRGALKATTEPRSPHTVNRELRATGTVLNYARRLGLLPRVSSDDLRDALAKLPVASERIDYRKPHELQALLSAALRHDADTFAATREELAGARPLGSTLRYQPIAPFVATAVLTGMRFAEIVELDWKAVDLQALDNDSVPVGEIYLTSATKTHKARTVGLEVSPALRKMLVAMRLASGGKGSVFGHTKGTAHTAMRRLISEYGASRRCNWQALRRTCGTYLTNAPGIFGAASAYQSAKQLGHSVQVAERHYLGIVRGIRRDARTLEAAMQIESEMGQIVAAVGGAKAAKQAGTR